MAHARVFLLKDDQLLNKLEERITTKNVILTLFFFGLVVFLNACINDFVLDDFGQIVNNPNVHTVKFVNIFFSNFGGQDSSLYYRPLTYFFYSILYYFFSQDTFFYHLVQLFFHIGNSILIFLIFSCFLKRGTSFFLAALFLVHPINEEAVVYIANLQDVLFLFFGLLAIRLLQRNSENTQHIIYANIPMFLSLLSKETGVLFLVVGLFFVYFFKKGKLLLYSSLSALVFLIYFFLRTASHIPLRKEAIIPIMELSFLERIINIPAIVFYYIKTFIFPKDLVSLHSWVVRDMNVSDFFTPLFFDVFFLFIIIYACFFVYTKTKNLRFPLFFFAWFLLGLSAHLQFIPIDTTVSDRYFYFPFIGLLAIFGMFFENLKIDKRTIIYCISICVVVLGALSVRTMDRNLDWRDQTTLLTHDITVSKNDYLLELLYAADLLRNKKIDEAFPHIQKSIEFYPESSQAWTILGVYYYEKKDIENAEMALERAIDVGGYYGAYENLAKIKYEKSDLDEAKDFIVIATARYPKSEKLWYTRFLLGYKMDDYDEQVLSTRNCYMVSGSVQCYALYNHLLKKLPIILQ